MYEKYFYQIENFQNCVLAISNSTEIFWAGHPYQNFKFKIEQKNSTRKCAVICFDVTNILLFMKITFNVLNMKKNMQFYAILTKV